MTQDKYAILSGQIALVTGSTGGIGRAIAFELARSGAAVIVHGGRNREQGQKVVDEIQSLGYDATLRMADFSDTVALEKLGVAAWAWRGRVDILVNNAGTDILTSDYKDKSFDEKLDRLWQVDVLGTIRLSRQLGRRMKEAGSGCIINLGWDGAARGMATDSGQLFGAAKGAVAAFSRSLAHSLAPEVRVNCLALGWIKTAWGHQASEDWQKRVCDESLAQRWGLPEDVARAASFLASPAAEFINGQVIDVNGGFRWTSD